MTHRGFDRFSGAKSPDEWDAVALRFAVPVARLPGVGRRIEYPPAGRGVRRMEPDGLYRVRSVGEGHPGGWK